MRIIEIKPPANTAGTVAAIEAMGIRLPVEFLGYDALKGVLYFREHSVG
jgi:hypothetical protein